MREMWWTFRNEWQAIILGLLLIVVLLPIIAPLYVICLIIQRLAEPTLQRFDEMLEGAIYAIESSQGGLGPNLRTGRAPGPQSLDQLRRSHGKGA